MTADPWSTKFICHVEQLYGPLHLHTLRSDAEYWAHECFPIDARPTVEILLATGPEATLVPLDDLSVDAVDRGVLQLTGAEFAPCVLRWFQRRNAHHHHYGGDWFDDDTVTLIIGAERTCLVYSHLYGDETVFYPKSRRLLTAVSSPLTGELPSLPPLTDVRSLTGRRLVASAARVAITRPRAALAAARVLAAERKRAVPGPIPSVAVDDSWWGITVNIERASAPKIPSVLLYCTVLRELGISPTVQNHVVAEIRGYSPHVRGTDGNAISHVPFTVDWSMTSAADCAAAIATRIRAAEPAIRIAAARVLRKYGPRIRSTSDTASASGTAGIGPALVTTMSYFRLPAGQTLTAADGGRILCTGFQTSPPGMLNFNCRDMDGVASITATHWGGLVDSGRVLAALRAAAAEVGCEVTGTFEVELETRNAPAQSAASVCRSASAWNARSV